MRQNHISYFHRYILADVALHSSNIHRNVQILCRTVYMDVFRTDPASLLLFLTVHRAALECPKKLHKPLFLLTLIIHICPFFFDAPYAAWIGEL